MITIIAAVAKNLAIGKDNKLLYWLPNDMKRFKSLTTDLRESAQGRPAQQKEYCPKPFSQAIPRLRLLFIA